MALTKVIGFGIGTIVDNLVMTSDDPTITMTDSSGTTDIATLVATSGALIVTARDGNANGEIIFKGNTGSAVTEHMRINNAGIVTKPLQPAFQVKPSTNQNNIANNAQVTLGTEVFDTNDDFASNTFNAPVTGKYQLNAALGLLQVDSAAAFIGIDLVTSNRHYYVIVDPDFGQDAEYWELTLAVIADMDAGDTVTMNFLQSGGTTQADVQNSHTNFSGYLLG